MAKSANQKLKLLSENTDEEHPASTADIIAYLEANDIHSERKSIYDDIEKLRDFGYDILQVHSRRGGGYYMGGRDFELAELKLLVDAVQSSRFITSRKSRSLIKKLELLAGKHDAGKLQRQVYVAGRVKTENESIYYSIDNIHRAIQENRQIAFQYLDWNLKKELVPRPNGEKKVSPWALIWQDENYYLAAYDSASGVMKHLPGGQDGAGGSAQRGPGGHGTVCPGGSGRLYQSGFRDVWGRRGNGDTAVSWPSDWRGPGSLWKGDGCQAHGGRDIPHPRQGYGQRAVFWLACGNRAGGLRGCSGPCAAALPGLGGGHSPFHGVRPGRRGESCAGLTFTV